MQCDILYFMVMYKILSEGEAPTAGCVAAGSLEMQSISAVREQRH